MVTVSLSSTALPAQYKANSAEGLMKWPSGLRRCFLNSRAADEQISTCFKLQFCVASFTGVLILPDVLFIDKVTAWVTQLRGRIYYPRFKDEETEEQVDGTQEQVPLHGSTAGLEMGPESPSLGLNDSVWH